MPAPDQYLNSMNKSKTAYGKLKGGNQSSSEMSETASQAAARKLEKATAPVLLGDEQNFKNFGQTVFGVAKRRSWIMKKERIYGPGPGHYRLQSDFGLYCNMDDTGQIQQQYFDSKLRVSSKAKNKGQVNVKKPITAPEVEKLKNLRLDETILTPE